MPLRQSTSSFQLPVLVDTPSGHASPLSRARYCLIFDPGAEVAPARGGELGLQSARQNEGIGLFGMISPSISIYSNYAYCTTQSDRRRFLAQHTCISLHTHSLQEFRNDISACPRVDMSLGSVSTHSISQIWTGRSLTLPTARVGMRHGRREYSERLEEEVEVGNVSSYLSSMSGRPARNSPSPSPPPPEHRAYLQCIDRTCRANVPKYELTSFYASSVPSPTSETPSSAPLSALSAFVRDMYAYFYDRLDATDAIVGLDALGLPLAAGLAVLADKPMVTLRKAGKLALLDDEVARSQPLYEGDKVLEVRKDLIRPGMRVIVV